MLITAFFFIFVTTQRVPNGVWAGIQHLYPLGYTPTITGTLDSHIKSANR